MCVNDVGGGVVVEDFGFDVGGWFGVGVDCMEVFG